MTVQKPVSISEQNFLQTLLGSGSVKWSEKWASKHLQKEAKRTLSNKEDAHRATEVCDDDKGTRDLWVKRNPSMIRLTGMLFVPRKVVHLH